VCGASRRLKAFGIDENGDFDAEERPDHLIERLVQDFQGRGAIVTVERGGVSMDQAKSLRASLQAALDKLDSEIAEADDDEVENDYEDDADESAED
jgi:hypothetical protein